MNVTIRNKKEVPPMRSMEMSAKTVEAAVQAACEALGVDRDDINVSYEVLEFPTR
ncbi:MAG TPA: hypothetical protein DDW15_00570, partial [Subdoligranulum sp.]|nr:hypothetical protein [Subdoligranulum sp.]